MPQLRLCYKTFSLVVIQVLLVAGGRHGFPPFSYLSSVEMLLGLNAKVWAPGKQLPSPRTGTVGISLGNRFLLTGINPNSFNQSVPG